MKNLALETSLVGIKVLLVDDQSDSRCAVAVLLEGMGAEPVSASSADEAISLLNTNRFDVLISDIGMPSKDGYELISEIRQSSAPHSKIPAIAMTAFTSLQDQTRASQAGFQAHVQKPFDFDILVDAIEMVVRK